MIRLIWTFLIIAGIAGLLTWFADRPGLLTIDWLDTASSFRCSARS